MIPKTPCVICGKHIEGGLYYFAKTKGNQRFRSRTQFFHAECWEKLPKRGGRDGVKK